MPQIARLWRQLADSTLAEFGVSNSAGWCLLYLDRLGADVRQIELADVLGITYEEINVWLFCIAWPLTSTAMLIWILLLRRKNRALRRTAVCQ